jgi:ABC-type transport system involved in multi-copper enzyme maturation permease subunit
MVGAVLRQELLLGSRRNRLRAFRWAFAAWLLLLILFCYARFQAEQVHHRINALNARVNAMARVGNNPAAWRNLPPDPRPNDVSAPTFVGGLFTDVFARQLLLLLALATPVFVAGAITDEKRRGTLPQLLTTDLDTRHILLGKLLGRTAQVLLIALTGLPPFALLAGFAGLGPVQVLMLAAALAGPLFALASAAVLASVLCRQTRDAILALYAVGVPCGLVVWYVGGPLEVLNPLSVLDAAWGPAGGMAEAWRLLAWSAGCYLAVGGACLGLAVWQVRPALRREIEGRTPQSGPARWYQAARVSVGDDPVRWRERHVEGLAPGPALRRIPRWLAITAIATATTVSSLTILACSMPPGKDLADLAGAVLAANPAALEAALPDAAEGFLVQSLVVMLLASLVVGVRCSGAVTGERERQTWEALLLTPLSAAQILDGKLWGVLGACLWYLLAYAAPAVTLSALGGPLALFWTLLWLAVTLLALYYVGSAGLWCSVRSRNSWRSLLGTLAAGYVGGVALYLATSPVWYMASLLVTMVLTVIDRTWGTRTAVLMPRGLVPLGTPTLLTSSAVLAAIFWLTARLFRKWARRWVADRDRTRHWAEEPVFRRSRRRVPLEPPAAR